MMMIQNMKVEVDVENKEGLDKDYNWALYSIVCVLLSMNEKHQNLAV